MDDAMTAKELAAALADLESDEKYCNGDMANSKRLRSHIGLLSDHIAALSAVVRELTTGEGVGYDDDVACRYCGYVRIDYRTYGHDPACPIARGREMVKP